MAAEKAAAARSAGEDAAQVAAEKAAAARSAGEDQSTSASRVSARSVLHGPVFLSIILIDMSKVYCDKPASLKLP